MERLINLVRENPGLYEQTSPHYKDNIWIANKWKALNPNFRDVADFDGKSLLIVCIKYLFKFLFLSYFSPQVPCPLSLS